LAVVDETINQFEHGAVI